MTEFRNDGVNLPRRKKVNLHPGANVTITSTDDEANDELDVTITSGGGQVSQSEQSTIGVSAEDADVVTVTIQLKDALDANISTALTVLFYLSEDAGGAEVTDNAPSGGVAVTTGELAMTLTASVAFFATTDATGALVITVEDNGTDTWYPVVVHPNGQKSVGAAITTAA